jgi:hypothetical protein
MGYWWESQKERPLGRSRRRWMDNIRMDLGEVISGDMDWIGLVQDRNKSCEFGNGHSGSIEC